MYNNLLADGSFTGVSRAPSLMLIASGTWGSGTLKVQIFDSEFDDYIDMPGVSYTADVSKEIVIGFDTLYKIVLTGSTEPDLDVITLPISTKTSV